MKKMLVPLALVSLGLAASLFTILPSRAQQVASDPARTVPASGEALCEGISLDLPTRSEFRANPTELSQRAADIPLDDLQTAVGCDFLVLPAEAIAIRDLSSTLALPDSAKVTELRGYIKGLRTVASIGIGVEDGETLDDAIKRASKQFEESFAEDLRQAAELAIANQIDDGLDNEAPQRGTDDGALASSLLDSTTDQAALGQAADRLDAEHFAETVDSGGIMILAIRVVSDEASRSRTATDLRQVGPVVAVRPGAWLGGAAVVPVIGGGE